MQSHVIFGAGLIGSFIGSVLTSLNIKTTLICRPYIKDKLIDGVLLTDYLEHQITVDRLTFFDPEDLKSSTLDISYCDFLWITVKCTAIKEVSKQIGPFIGFNTIVLCCQNGLGSDDIIKQCFPNTNVLRVMIPFNIAEPKPGHLHRGSEGSLFLETNKSVHSKIMDLAKKLDSPIMPVNYTQEMTALLWAKLQLNLGNSINALADIPVKSMLEERAYRIVIAELMTELLSVTKALTIRLPKLTAVHAHYLPLVLRLPNFIFNRVAKKMLAIDPTVRTSMWWDLSQGKLTEIDHLNGAIVTIAKRLNIPCPANHCIIGLIKNAEQQNSKHQNTTISGKTLLKLVKGQ
ncbi:2-dehydropantoate 2-reductase [Aquimarina sp. AD10]|uniref:2-dehydropantoate 2-reductase n=1 Tax=Aquimarina sp. AD10 TaxID=1714849 RepID=UPI000E552611|nr:2-dehydropantoate 2-reductase [Aquimarina sp. AD10]AXT59899.1 2-dehydropantoate 2-reductase [Aquimarina sp. AD10]RKN00183.1 2-dehydropantoate 2-reductase [Aquimarina sp. AD10]